MIVATWRDGVCAYVAADFANPDGSVTEYIGQCYLCDLDGNAYSEDEISARLAASIEAQRA